ncbi:probable inactive protein kinase DDB_G0270444 isoform X2 [Linepithema humile]|uniref:probable inactive protein kinase DDB_G0270444 isoform X2 n=1 Tax=Linepithema humile TaxID=83485 RepID=UPI00351F1E5A
MSNESIRNLCPPTCPTVKRQIRAAIAEAPWLLDGIFPRKRNAVNSRVPSDIIPKDTQDEPKRVIKADVQKAAVDDHERIETDVPSKLLKDIKARPIQKQVVIQEVKTVEEPIIPTEKITDRDDKKIDLAEEKELVQKIAIIREPTVILTEKIADYNGEKIDLIEEKELGQEAAVIQEPAIVPIEKITDRDDKKIDLVEEKELVQEAAIIQEPTVIRTEKIAERDDKKIDLIEEKEVPVAIKELEIDRAAPAEIDLEPSVEAEEYFELEKRVKPDEGEETLTDYEKFIDEELQEALPAVIAKEIPEEPREVRREISKDAAALYEEIDRERAVRPPREREATTAIPEEREEITIRTAPANSTRAKRIVSRRAAQDACDETCPLVKEQKEHIMRKLKEQQRIIDHYYLTKGFSYFEDVCTCSLACMVYTLSRDPFVRSIFASLALFAVGLKLCSELDAWEMPSRVS